MYGNPHGFQSEQQSCISGLVGLNSRMGTLVADLLCRPAEHRKQMQKSLLQHIAIVTANERYSHSYCEEGKVTMGKSGLRKEQDSNLDLEVEK